MHEIALSLGTNSGDREYFLSEMERDVSTLFSSPLCKSPVYETEPVGVDGVQPWFLNRIVAGMYDGTPADLLNESQMIELRLGRNGKGMRKARTADVDILLFGHYMSTTHHLIIPHPALLERRFCLEGLKAVLSDFILPSTGRSIAYHYTHMEQSVRQQTVRLLSGKESA